MLQEWSGVGPHDGRWQERKHRIDSPREAYSNYALEIFANQTGARGTIQLGRIQFLDADEIEISWECIDVNSERCHGDENYRNLQTADRVKWCTNLEVFPDNIPRFEFTFPQPVTVATLVFTSADDAPERDPSRFSLSSSSSVNVAACRGAEEAARAKKMQTAEFQSYKAQALAELQKKGMWVGVLPEEATLAMLSFYGINESVLTLASPQDSDASRVVVKISRVLKGEASTILPCHLALSEHGVAVPLLAHTLDFTVEAEAKARTDGFCDSLPGYLDNAGVTARLHRAPTSWFDGQCREVLQDYVPLLKEEPLNSALYVAAAHERSRGVPKEDMPQTEKLRELMAVLPRPVGEHAERLVVVHGDLWDANILHMPDGRTVLCDFEQTVVSSAVQDLVHVSQKPLVAAYLEAMTGAQPSEEEVYRLLLETKIAEHVHFFVIRALFFDDRPGKIDELTEHSRQFGVFATKLRKDPEWAKKLLGDGHDDCAWRADVVREPWNLKMDDPLVDTSDMQSFKLTLQSHPGKSVICQERFGHQFPEGPSGRGNWLSLGDADCALQVSYGGGSVYKTDETFLGLHIGGGNPGPVEEGNTVLMGSWSQPEFIVNQDDGTISPKANDQLVLGHGPCNLYDLKGREMVIFVPRGSPQKLVFDALPCAKVL